MKTFLRRLAVFTLAWLTASATGSFLAAFLTLAFLGGPSADLIGVVFVAVVGLAFALPTALVGLTLAVLLEFRLGHPLSCATWMIAGAAFAAPTAIFLFGRGNQTMLTSLGGLAFFMIAGAIGGLTARWVRAQLRNRWLDTANDDVAEGII